MEVIREEKIINLLFGYEEFLEKLNIDTSRFKGIYAIFPGKDVHEYIDILNGEWTIKYKVSDIKKALNLPDNSKINRFSYELIEKLWGFKLETKIVIEVSIPIKRD